jgi:hypothetical protein
MSDLDDKIAATSKAAVIKTMNAGRMSYGHLTSTIVTCCHTAPDAVVEFRFSCRRYMVTLSAALDITSEMFAG